METPASTFVPVIKFRFGATARDSEGQTGSLVSVVLDPAHYTVLAVGVRFGVFGRATFAPISAVAAATDAGVELRETRAELAKSDKAPAGALLDGGSTVTQNGRRLGKLAQISFNADTRALRHLIVERGLGSEYVVAAASVSQITQDSVALTASANGAHPAFTSYRPDAELREDVQRTLEDYNRLRVDIEGINVSATDGVVWLRGHVSSELNRRLASDLLGEIKGIGELHNELETDPDLAARISVALARDPRTAEERIGVYPMLGVVRLRGVVRTPAAREAAEQIARSIHTDGDVDNDLRVDPNANVLPVLSSVTNTEDVVPGGR
ncbi:MAG: BON domain-containing protein [Chloroflexota bacterium]|nr:BON domain-containing protein [Chloroflexota bacterium]